MKKCAICKIEKLEAEFNKNAAKSDGLQTQCRDCNKKRMKKYYSDNKEKHKKVIRNLRIKKLEEIRNYVLEYFSSHPCVDCGESDPIVLEFDHVRGKKKGHVMRGISDGWSLETTKEEIGKCEVRCANCHRRKTARDFGSFRLGS